MTDRMDRWSVVLKHFLISGKDYQTPHSFILEVQHLLLEESLYAKPLRYARFK